MTGRFFASATAAITAAFGSSLCCAGPTVAAALGFSGAGLAAFLPYRPYMVIVGAAALWTGFHLLDKEDEKACRPDQPCANPAVRNRMRRVIWFTTALFFLFGTSPIWVDWIL